LCKKGPAVKRIGELSQTNVQFKQFLDECHTDSRVRKLPLSSFLIKPVQRITKYPLLFKELVLNTPKEHPDFERLIEVKQKIEHIVVHVNEGQRRFEAQQRILSIQNSIDGEFELLAPARVLLREGTILMKISNTDKPSEHQIFLFNDMILFAKKNILSLFAGKEFNLVAEVPFEGARLVLWADDETQPTRKIFQVITGDKTFTLGFVGKEETQSWFNSIKKAIKEFQQRKLKGVAILTNSGDSQRKLNVG